MADWVTISALATAGGTLVLAGATFSSVRSAHASTRVTERALLASIRPLLVPTRLEDPLELRAICVASDLSPRHLQRLCLEQLGETPSDFYRALRLKHARNLLLHGSESILEVATACGFVSASHFSRRYRQLFGTTPSDDRRRQRTGAFERAMRG